MHDDVLRVQQSPCLGAVDDGVIDELPESFEMRCLGSCGICGMKSRIWTPVSDQAVIIYTIKRAEASLCSGLHYKTKSLGSVGLEFESALDFNDALSWTAS